MQVRWTEGFQLGLSWKKNKKSVIYYPNSSLFSLGKLWSRSVKLAYTLLNKLGTKNEQILKPGDRVRAEKRKDAARRQTAWQG